VYDREIAAFAATLEQGGGALAANVDDLADGPGAVQGKAKAESATEEKNAATPEAESADVDHDEL
jgi:hypothetical protein